MGSGVQSTVAPRNLILKGTTQGGNHISAVYRNTAKFFRHELSDGQTMSTCFWSDELIFQLTFEEKGYWVLNAKDVKDHPAVISERHKSHRL